jgi:tetratricopeptide (TPR) repeat protein
MGRLEEAIAAVRRAREIDPLALVVHHLAAWIYFHARRFDEVIEICRKVLDMEPNYVLGYFWLGLACAEKGMHEEALTALRRAADIAQSPAIPGYLGPLGHACACAGLSEEASQCYERLARPGQAFWVDPYHLAVVRVGLGEPDLAFECLEQAYTDRSLYLTIWAKGDPRLDPLRADPRFDDLLRRLGLGPRRAGWLGPIEIRNSKNQTSPNSHFGFIPRICPPSEATP